MIIDCGSPKTPEISEILNSFKVENKEIKLAYFSAETAQGASAIIISGSPLMLTELDQKEIAERYSFIKNLDVPILGICFGHQLLGVVFGSGVSRGPEKIEGKEKINFIPDPLFNGIENNSEFSQHHEENITLPEGFILLGSSKTCENEAMKHKDKPIYGVQFHPEVSGEPGKQLIKNFLKINGL